ncbi:MAG: hypothetical protein K0Q95_2467 [Bacteroidota bacterium]|jgi:hypothetical protein|nr:hypothetical protein [Bacteroidota bacterium]
MEQLIKMVTEKAGISEAQAKKAVDAVVNFLKDKMPAGVGSQVESFVKGSGTTGASGTLDSIKNGISGKLGGVAGL